jgi:hypothetical protein
MIENLVIPSLPKNGITFFDTPPDFNPGENWIHRYISWTHTYKEWIDLINGFRKPLFGNIGPQVNIISIPFPPYIPNTVPDVFFHRDIAADLFEHWFQRNQAIRWQMKRLLMAHRRRHMDARTIGEVDVGTMEPIPANLLVTVYDWNSRARYRFHADTIHRQIVGSLRYQSLAISLPSAPKNPYTNLSWGFGQLMVIYDQVNRRLWDVKRKFMDPAAQAFHHSNLCLTHFKTIYGPTLDVECAMRFFRDTTAECWELLYREALDDLFLIIHPKRPEFLQTMLVDRCLSTDLLREWDDMVFGFWCYDNLARLVLPTVCSIYDMIEMARTLVEKTEEILQKRKKIVLAKRRPPARNNERSERDSE